MMTKNIENKIKKAVLSGISCPRVANMFNVCTNTVYEHTKKERAMLNLAREKRNEAIKQLYIAGWSRSDLAKKYSISTGSISLICVGLRERDYFGEANPAWKGGVTSLQEKIRKSDKYLAWRLSVFERDNFTCQITGEKCNKLVADHIKPFAVILHENKIKTLKDAYNCKELWDINNGRTIKAVEHYKTDTYGHKTTKLIAQMSTRRPNTKHI